MMKRAVVFTLLLAACATQQASGPPVEVAIAQLNAMGDAYNYEGPVNVQFQVTVGNPTDQQITLTRMDLRTEAQGAYELNTRGFAQNVMVAPKSTARSTLSVWGHAPGGYLNAHTPVTIYVTAYFDSPTGSFVKVFHANVWQP